MARTAFAALTLLGLGAEGFVMQMKEAQAHGEANLTETKMHDRATRAPPLRSQLVVADRQIAQALRKRREDPYKIAASVQKGLTAVMNAASHFIAQPPDVSKGLQVLGDELLEAISEPIREHFDTDTPFAMFEAEWRTYFVHAREVSPSVQGNITLFLEGGDPAALITALGEIFTTLGEGVVDFVPHEIAQEVVTYLDTVGDLLDTIGMSWTGFESGEEAQAIEDLYFGMREVVGQVLPQELQNDETFKLVIGTLDGVIYGLSETVLDFQRQIVHGAVCWKTQEARLRKRPSVCQEGFYWNGEQFCLPVPTAVPQGGRLAGQFEGQMEDVIARKVDDVADAKKPVPDGAMVALCEDASGFSMKIGHWCYAACPVGMVPVAGGKKCKTQCGGRFPADDNAMLCGENPAVLAEATMNMVVGVISGAFNSAMLIAKMASGALVAGSLVNTIEAFVNMGKPFAYSTCQ